MLGSALRAYFKKLWGKAADENRTQYNMIYHKASTCVHDSLKATWVLAFLRLKSTSPCLKSKHENVLYTLKSCHESCHDKIKEKDQEDLLITSPNVSSM